tara:strand:- start:17872 stop:18171 length:300 start_codon:yes stop_codon:yes gene_type:complete
MEVYGKLALRDFLTCPEFGKIFTGVDQKVAITIITIIAIFQCGFGHRVEEVYKAIVSEIIKGPQFLGSLSLSMCAHSIYFQPVHRRFGAFAQSLGIKKI